MSHKQILHHKHPLPLIPKLPSTVSTFLTLYSTFGLLKIACIDWAHGLSNYKDTTNKMSSLLVFNRIYRLEIQSVMLVFSTQLCKLLPL